MRFSPFELHVFCLESTEARDAQLTTVAALAGSALDKVNDDAGETVDIFASQPERMLAGASGNVRPAVERKTTGKHRGICWLWRRRRPGPGPRWQSPPRSGEAIKMPTGRRQYALPMVAKGKLRLNEDAFTAFMGGFEFPGFRSVVPRWPFCAPCPAMGLVVSDAPMRLEHAHEQFPRLREPAGDRVAIDIAAHGFAIVERAFENAPRMGPEDVANGLHGG